MFAIAPYHKLRAGLFKGEVGVLLWHGEVSHSLPAPRVRLWMGMRGGFGCIQMDGGKNLSVLVVECSDLHVSRPERESRGNSTDPD